MAAFFCEAQTVYSSPAGQRKKVTLPDGTQVLLNSHSTLKFSRTARKKNIYLDGDAYFDVKKSSVPVIIHCSQLIITTSNSGIRVNAYADIAGEEADVLTGTVKVKKAYKSTLDSSTYTLKNGDMIMINRSIDLIEKERFDSADLKEWISGQLVFRNAGLHDLTKKMETWFNIEMQAEGRVPGNLSYTGAFNNASLQTVLATIGRSWKFKYNVARNKAILKF